MAIASANPNITVQTAAKQSCEAGAAAVLGASQPTNGTDVLVPDAITANNEGNLETSPSYVGRAFMLRPLTRLNIGGGIAVSAVVNAGGSGYSVNDTLSLSGGTASDATNSLARFNVDSVNAGAVTAVSLVDRGGYTVLPGTGSAPDALRTAVATTVSPAGGTGATLDVTFEDGEEVRFITADSSNTLTVHEAWTHNPLQGDDWAISYIIQDVATVNGMTLRATSGIYEASRNLRIGGNNTDDFAFLALVEGNAVELNDTGSSTVAGLQVLPGGWLQCGYLVGDLQSTLIEGTPISGAWLFGINNTNGELLIEVGATNSDKHMCLIYGTKVRCARASQETRWRSGTTADLSPQIILKGIDFYNASDDWESEGGIVVRDASIEADNAVSIFQFNADSSNTTVDGVSLVSGLGLGGISGALGGVDGSYTFRNLTFAAMTNRYISAENISGGGDGPNSWNMVNVRGLVDNVDLGSQTQISFVGTGVGTSDVNVKNSLDVSVLDTLGAAIAAVRQLVFSIEDGTTSWLRGENNVATDANGEVSSDVIERRYTEATISTLNLDTFTAHAVRLYKYGKDPLVNPLTLSEDAGGQTITATMVDDIAITEADQVTAIENGDGIALIDRTAAVDAVFGQVDLDYTGQPSNNDTVTLAGKTYTFQTTLTDVDGNVEIGVDADTSYANLAGAINGLAGSYAASMTLHPSLEANHISASDVIELYAIAPGVAGNGLAVSESLTNATLSSSSTSGGVDSTHPLLYLGYSDAPNSGNGSLPVAGDVIDHLPFQTTLSNDVNDFVGTGGAPGWSTEPNVLRRATVVEVVGSATSGVMVIRPVRDNSDRNSGWFQDRGWFRTVGGSTGGNWIIEGTGGFNYLERGDGRAQGFLVLAAQPTAGDTMTIGSVTYTFQASVTGDDEIDIGATLNATLDNIVNAINRNGAGTPGTDFSANIVKHPDVYAYTAERPQSFEDTVAIRAFVAGAGGDSIATSETFTATNNRWTNGSTLENGGESLAKGTLQIGAAIGDGDTVTIDGKTYTFQATLTDVDGNVHVGGNLVESLQHLAKAMILGEGSGSDYAASMTEHSTYRPDTGDAIGTGDATLTVQAKIGGTGANADTLAVTGMSAADGWVPDGATDGTTGGLAVAAGADDSFTWEIDANAEAMTVVYDYQAAKLAARKNPIVLQDDGGTFTEFTTEAANDVAEGALILDDDVKLLPATPAQNDATYFGSDTEVFESITLDMTTAMTTATDDWEYWNGSAWTNLAGQTNPTAFESTGIQTFSFTLPTNWATTVVNGITAYWIRRVETNASPAGQPEANQVWLDQVWTDFILSGEDEFDFRQAVFLGADGYFTNRAVTQAEGVFVSDRGVGSIDFFTADNGAQFVPAVSVTVTFKFIDSTGANISGVNVILGTTAGSGNVIDNILSNASGEVSVSYTGTVPQAVEGFARKGTKSPTYKFAPLSGTITAQGLTATVTLFEDE